MFGNFAKIGRAAGASLTCLLLAWQNWILLNVNFIFSRQSAVLQDFQPKFGAFVRTFI
jgi:hypothetical protein